MLRRLPVIAALLLVTSASPAADTQGIYKWTDDQGEVHYTQFPPPGHKAVKLHAAPPPAHSPEVVTGNQLPQQQQKPSQGATDTTQQAEIQKVRKSNCEAARTNLANLQRGGNIRYKLASGEVIRMTEEDRQKRIDEANKQIKENCTP
jgi:hypothetical protein